MPASPKRSKSRPHSGVVTQFQASAGTPSQPWLVTATDLCLWSTIIAVAIGFGGRMANGQLALVIGASATALCWLLYQLTTSTPRYSWTGSEWLWLGGIAVGAAQLVPLPTNYLHQLSPKLKELLPLWYDPAFASLITISWTQLSLAPWETASGLATFVSYAMLFLVAAQRMKSVQDVERSLCFVALAVVAMMLFAQAQFLTSNGRFFWVYEHPHMSTDSYPLGCFTNRNHLAQFLSLGIGPLIWWLLRRLHQQELDRAQRRALPTPIHLFAIVCLLLSLGGIGATILMTLSRGGLLAMGIASVIASLLMCRIGLASLKFGFALLVVGAGTAVLLSSSKYESVLADRLEQNSGRIDIWTANYQVAKDFPVLGTGIGTHADAYHTRFQSKQDDGLEYSHAECGYLQVASETGIAGLTVAALFILTSFWWCLGSLRNADPKVSSAAAAIVASLCANVGQAAVDFFWYTPVCMLLLAVQLAGATRLYRLTRQDAQVKMFSFRLPRLITAMSFCVVLAVGAWMWDMKFPSFLAEPHRIQSILLARSNDTDWTEEEKASTNELRLKETLLAAKLDPRDSRMQEAAGAAYVQLFEIKQEHSENTMSASMLRDGAKASEFTETRAKLQWLQNAVGPNLKMLRLASRSLKRAIRCCPLRARSYVLLTELVYLEREEDEQFQTNCLEQALKIRPRDAETLYLVGKSALQESDMDRAMSYWRPAFERSRSIQERISELLAGHFPPSYFEENFQPDWKAYETILKVYSKAGLDQEAADVQQLLLVKGIEKARKTKSDRELEAMLISISGTCRDMGDVEAAIDVLTYAAKRLPHNYPVRYMLGLDLLKSGRSDEAANHLEWCARREPGNQELQVLATKAMADKMKSTGSHAHLDPEVEQIEYRR